MYLPIKLERAGKIWLVEIPELDLMTQGKTKKDALSMISDAVESLVNNREFKTTVVKLSHSDSYYLTTSDSRALMALMLKRQREMNHMSIGDVSTTLRYSSRNSYAQFESGKHAHTIEKFDELIKSINPSSCFVVQILETSH